MQSGQDNQSLPQQPVTNTPIPNPLDPVLPVQAREILKGMKDADTPLDFIRANIKAPENQIDPAAMTKAVEASREVSATPPPVTSTPEPLKPPETIYDINPPKVEAPKTEPKPIETAPAVEPTTVEPIEDAPLSDKEENFKALRHKFSETAKALEEKAKKAEELEARVKAFETGEELPEVIRQKDERITELEKYERLHALKLSPAYKEAFVKPVEEIKTRLGEVAKEYEIPEDVLTQALNITNRRDLTAFLSEHFDDIAGAEVRDLVSQAQTLAARARDAEAEPARALESLEETYHQNQEAHIAQSRNAIVDMSKAGWIDSLLEIRKEGRIQELIHRESDTEYNKQVVEPILSAAASEYGKLIKRLVDGGLETLSKDDAFALARMVHLAHASAVSIDSRERSNQEAEEIRRNTERTTKYLRPAIGSVSGSSGFAPQGSTTTTPSEAADILINKVLSGKTG